MAVASTTAVELIKRVYAQFPERVALGRERMGRGLTIAEKILFAHADDPATVAPSDDLSQPRRVSQPCPNLPKGVGDTKTRSKTTVSPTSPSGPNLLLYIHVGERKTSGTCPSIRKE
jgi:hypothetical protein